jgi:hypothetical protein
MLPEKPQILSGLYEKFFASRRDVERQQDGRFMRRTSGWVEILGVGLESSPYFRSLRPSFAHLP